MEEECVAIADKFNKSIKLILADILIVRSRFSICNVFLKYNNMHETVLKIKGISPVKKLEVMVLDKKLIA